MIFRALDYLPPGEVSFADYGRAMIVVDNIAYSHDPKMREWICEEFLTRGIIHQREALDIETEFEFAGLEKVDAAKLYSSDWTAYWFANQHREFLFIPEQVEFEVRSRLLLKKKYAEGIGQELLFKVSWEVEETHDIGSRYPSCLRVPVGTTIAVNWKTKEILARLTNAPSEQQKREQRKIPAIGVRDQEYHEQKAARGRFIRHLAEQRLLKRSAAALDHNGKPLLSAIHAEVADGRMRIHGAGKLFHIIETGGEET